MYTGNPLPVILLPSSKFIRLYFVVRSQCGVAPAYKLGLLPPSLTTTLSSGVLPAGTFSEGRLGSRYKIAWIFFSASSSLSGASCVFHSATFALVAAACSFSPLAINWPICLEDAFIFACISSCSSWYCRRFSSHFISSSTSSGCLKFLMASLCLTSSLCCFIKPTCSIL